MRRWKVYARRWNGRWIEAHRTWTKAGAERWVIANMSELLDYWKVDRKP